MYVFLSSSGTYAVAPSRPAKADQHGPGGPIPAERLIHASRQNARASLFQPLYRFLIFLLEQVVSVLEKERTADPDRKHGGGGRADDGYFPVGGLPLQLRDLVPACPHVLVGHLEQLGERIAVHARLPVSLDPLGRRLFRLPPILPVLKLAAELEVIFRPVAMPPKRGRSRQIAKIANLLGLVVGPFSQLVPLADQAFVTHVEQFIVVIVAGG